MHQAVRLTPIVIQLPCYQPAYALTRVQSQRSLECRVQSLRLRLCVCVCCPQDLDCITLASVFPLMFSVPNAMTLHGSASSGRLYHRCSSFPSFITTVLDWSVGEERLKTRLRVNPRSLLLCTGQACFFVDAPTVETDGPAPPQATPLLCGPF